MAAKYKITALQNVVVFANVPFQKRERIGDQTFMRPAQREEWVTLKAGDVREIGLITGIHPRCCPVETPTHIGAVAMIVEAGWSDADLPKEFRGLYRLELVPE